MAALSQQARAARIRWGHPVPPVSLDDYRARTRASTTGCWEFTGGNLTKDGYPQVWYPGSKGKRLVRLHRLIWELVHGPTKLHVLHRCDNRLCINPDHLFTGTNADNMRDRDAKGRQARGTRQPKAKLTDTGVVEMRNLHRWGATTVELARRFGVSQAVAWKVVNGKTWRHV